MTNSFKHRALGLLAALAIAPASQAWEGKTLKVCADPNNLPYSNQKGEGFENKIAELLADELDLDLEYTWFPQRMGFIRNTLKAEVEEGKGKGYKCDVIIGLPTGAEQAATTQPYYRSTYALVIAKKRGWDDIESPEDLDKLSDKEKAKLKMAMFDGSPATTWLLNHKLVEYSIPFQSMDSDATVSTAERVEQALKAGKLDMAIVWGPLAGYLATHNKGAFEVIPMHSEQGVKFEFPMSMGVRIPDKERKEELNKLIEDNQRKINKILTKYKVPLVDADGKLIDD